MSDITYIGGEIDLANIPDENKKEIKKLLDGFYGGYADEIFREDYLSFEEEWGQHIDTDTFMNFLLRLIPFLNKNAVARLMCEGETHNDYWSIIIKRQKLYVQRYRLKPIGDRKEFVYVPK